MENLQRRYLFAAHPDDINADKLPAGSRIWELGIAHPSLPPGRTLMLVEVITDIFMANMKPILETPA